jgi:transglutaminase-like putative cysteine protease
MISTDRRTLLLGSAAFAAGTLLPAAGNAQATFAPKPGAWRQFELKTRLQIDAKAGQAQAWIPLPAFSAPDWFRPEGSAWSGNAKSAAVKKDAKYGAEFVHVEWDPAERQPVVEVVSRFATRDRSVDWGKPGQAAPLSAAERALYLSATELIPIDGIVKTTSDKIVAGKRSDLEKAEAIFQWVVENTARNPATRGCGIGNIKNMLEIGDLTGKCADLNALYVGLARAAGIPARDVYGLRVASSAFGYKSLGTASENVTKAQHCRAEVHLDGFGWVPVDPADVRKVMLEEPPGKLAIDNAMVVAARRTLFGAWEMNWAAYNVAHDIVLPGAKGPTLEFLMYPQAELAGVRQDCLDPDSFAYTITSKSVSA